MIKKNEHNDTWFVYINLTGKNGIRKQKVLKSVPTKCEAKRLEEYWRVKLREMCELPLEHTLQTWFERYVTVITPIFKESTLLNYRFRYKKYISKASFLSKKLSDITTTDIYDFLQSIPGATPHTKKGILKDLRAIMQKAVDDGAINRNPTTPIKIKIPDKKLAVLNTTSVQELIGKAKSKDHPWYSIWVVAVTTGMRSGELYSLKWSDVDFEHMRISVNSSWSSKNGYGPTKNYHNRTVPISADLKKFLMELKLKSDPKDEFVLPHIYEWTRGEQALVLKAFCREIGITEVRFHDLRATFITQMLLAGVSLAKVMAIVGHSDLKTTNRYLRILGGDLDGATDNLKYTLPSDEDGRIVQLRPM